jgi:hypothetical protein
VVSVQDAANSGGGSRNTSPTDSLIFLDDEVPPSVAGVTAPSTIAPGSVTFTADATDNVEMGDVIASVQYNNDLNGYYAHNGAQSVGAYGVSPLDFSRTLAGANALSVTFNPFIYSVETTSSAGVPNADQAVAGAVNFAVRDVAGVQLNVTCPAPGAGDGAFGEFAPVSNRSNCIQRQNNNITPNVLAGTAVPSSYTVIAAGIASFVQNGPVRTGSTTTGTVVLEGEARGPQGTFANPFPNGVNFYRLDASLQRYIFVGSATGRAIDDDIQAVRRWVYTTSSLPVSQVPVGATIRALGVNTGRALRNAADRVVP